VSTQVKEKEKGNLRAEKSPLDLENLVEIKNQRIGFFSGFPPSALHSPPAPYLPF
jgi:hypothetical protein